MKSVICLVFCLFLVVYTKPYSQDRFLKDCLNLDEPFCDDHGRCDSGYECVQNVFEKSVFSPSNRGLCLKSGCSDQPPTPILPRNSRVKRGFLQSLQDFWAGMALWG